MVTSGRRKQLLLSLGLTITVGCTAPGGPDSTQNWNWRPDGGSSTATTQSAVCSPARASEQLPARVNAIAGESTGAASGGNTMYTEDLFAIFKADCGGCHVDTGLGNFKVSANTFATVVDQTVLDTIRSDDPAKAMPPVGKAFSQRPAGDPIVILAAILKQWIDQGRPKELFNYQDPNAAAADMPAMSSDGSDGDGAASPYLVSPQVGTAMTNIGNCVPGAGMVGTSIDAMDAMDQTFVGMTDLPPSLDQTDLNTLDTAQLARNRVIAYVPQYPLWTDGAGKLRYLRVPKGQSITFDKQTQRFTVPPNTRFYKTFLKQVVDRDGNQTYRKIETRVIVARPDKTLPDGTVQTTALFGTYLWNEDETKATKTNLPYRSGEPFTDTLLSIVTDEPREQAIRDSMPFDLSYALESANPPVKRHYAVPGSQRCIQCHMGSVNQDFILGFLPLQIARRESGTGGAYEETGPDELNQLQRLIDYGVITGMTPADVLPLEQSQGTRTARNDQELAAQAYMLGNCAHCHNPRGFPSVKNPELKDLLDFMPSTTGGVFQFPLTRESPLRRRGSQQETPMPYITPSLREFPAHAEDYPTLSPNGKLWIKKWVPECSVVSPDDANGQFFCGARKKGPAHLAAPWRSLLYRNIDTPFMYADDFVVFPHMPMNSPGYDCRITQILGSWMVSIPAARKNPEIDEDAVPLPAGLPTSIVQKPYDTNPQPYVEVLPSDPGYADAVTAAQARLAEYQAGGRYSFCPDTSDIVDPLVVKAGGNFPIVPAADDIYDPQDPTKLLQPGIGVPDRAHWVITDLTDPPGDWLPRRPDWEQWLLQGMADTSDLPNDVTARAQEISDRAQVLAALKDATLTKELSDFALTDLGYGLWQPNAGCDFSRQPKVSDFDNVQRPRPRWMDADPNHVPRPDAPVYMMSPGAAVFTNICINCHGPQADSKGLMADAIMNMTGGTARVADFRDGFLGPAATPGGNRQRVFGAPELQPSGLTPEDWASRYMAYMALGGTKAKLPDAVLNIVGSTKVLGAARQPKTNFAASANMLKLAKDLCHQVLPLIGLNPIDFDANAIRRGFLDWSEQTGLIDANADVEMWQHLCSIGHRQIIRVLVPDGSWIHSDGTFNKKMVIDPRQSFYWADRFPANAPVLDQRGLLQLGLTTDNLFPLCVKKPADPKDLAVAEAFLDQNPAGPKAARLPYCPDALFDPTQPSALLAFTVADQQYTFTDADQWALRGAVNAGQSVFLYLKKLESDASAAKIPYNHCEQLPHN